MESKGIQGASMAPKFSGLWTAVTGGLFFDIPSNTKEEDGSDNILLFSPRLHTANIIRLYTWCFLFIIPVSLSLTLVDDHEGTRENPQSRGKSRIAQTIYTFAIGLIFLVVLCLNRSLHSAFNKVSEENDEESSKFKFEQLDSNESFDGSPKSSSNTDVMDISIIPHNGNSSTSCYQDEIDNDAQTHLLRNCNNQNGANGLSLHEDDGDYGLNTKEKNSLTYKEGILNIRQEEGEENNVCDDGDIICSSEVENKDSLADQRKGNDKILETIPHLKPNSFFETNLVFEANNNVIKSSNFNLSQRENLNITSANHIEHCENETLERNVYDRGVLSLSSVHSSETITISKERDSEKQNVQSKNHIDLITLYEKNRKSNQLKALRIVIEHKKCHSQIAREFLRIGNEDACRKHQIAACALRKLILRILKNDELGRLDEILIKRAVKDLVSARIELLKYQYLSVGIEILQERDIFVLHRNSLLLGESKVAVAHVIEYLLDKVVTSYDKDSISDIHDAVNNQISNAENLGVDDISLLNIRNLSEADLQNSDSETNITDNENLDDLQGRFQSNASEGVYDIVAIPGMEGMSTYESYEPIYEVVNPIQTINCSFLGIKFEVNFCRQDLLAILDYTSNFREIFISVTLAMLCTFLGFEIGVYFSNLEKTIMWAVVTSSLFSQLKSVQPDSASPSFQDRSLAFSRTLYFCILSAFAIAFDRRISDNDKEFSHPDQITIMAGVMARRIHFTDGLLPRAKAVELEICSCGSIFSISAKREIILSAGALNTPQLLMLSGIGDRKQLEHHGIRVVADLPAVGKGLQDHPNCGIGLQFRADAFDRAKKPELQASTASLFLQSRIAKELGESDGFERGTDLQLVFGSSWRRSNKDTKTRFYKKYLEDNSLLNPHSARERYEVMSDIIREQKATEINSHDNMLSPILSGLGVILNQPLSSGQVSLRSSSPYDAPKVDLNYWSDIDGKDLKIMIEGLRSACRIANSPPLSNLIVEKPTLNGNEPTEVLEKYVRETCGSTWHYSCTCKLGATDDPNAVVTPDLRVKGVQGLRVADASVMPFVTSGNINVSCLAIGGRAATIILSDVSAK
eukprot:UC4_evm2s592